MPDEQPKSFQKEVGYVDKVTDYLVHLQGLPTVKFNEVIVSRFGARALVTALFPNSVEALMLDLERPKPGDYFERNPVGLRLPIGNKLIGRTINPLGVPMDGKGSLASGDEPLDIDMTAPGIYSRELITQQFYTGITMIDTLIPIGKGQRELLFGEARSGKTSFLLDIIIHQKDQNRICLYVAIGRSDVDVKRFTETLVKFGADSYTTIIAATSSEAAPTIMLAPFIGCAVAESFRNEGRDVLLIFDDLATHAKYLREIYLLAGRIPGRESYPADIFHQQSQLVERAGNFNAHLGGGSITLLPVIETSIDNVTGLIPTNVMSMTDGHILFSATLKAQGLYPSVDPTRSVTRVGRQTQLFIHKILSDRIRSLLADFEELERYGRFGSELSGETQKTIKRGKIIKELLKQELFTFIRPDVQIFLLSFVFTGFFDDKDVEFVRGKKTEIIKFISDSTECLELTKTFKTVTLDELLLKLSGLHGKLEAVCRTS